MAIYVSMVKTALLQAVLWWPCMEMQRVVSRLSSGAAFNCCLDIIPLDKHIMWYEEGSIRTLTVGWGISKDMAIPGLLWLLLGVVPWTLWFMILLIGVICSPICLNQPIDYLLTTVRAKSCGSWGTYYYSIGNLGYRLPLNYTLLCHFASQALSHLVDETYLQNILFS